MKIRPLILIAVVALVSESLPGRVEAQEKDKWQRVYTGEESVIEINVSNVRFEPDHVLRAEFRTVLAKPESLQGTPGLRYKSRLETIDFRLDDRRYRLYESTLVDPAGKALSSYKNTSEEWKVLKEGGINERLFNAARLVPPFGRWKVVEYRFAEGKPDGTGRTATLDRLIGTKVRLESHLAAVGAKVCSLPAYENKRATREELLRGLGIEMKAIGLNADHTEMINVRCEGTGWAPPQSLLIKVATGEMLMLWDGVFLVLKRES